MKRPSSLRLFIDNHPALHYLVIRLLRRKAQNSPCPFCTIVNKGAPARLLYQDDLVTAFRDAHPSAATHFLVVPNRHIASLNDLQAEDERLAGHMLLVAQELARQEGLLSSGYQIMFNTGLHAGQTVFHLHLHLRSDHNSG